MRHRFPRDFWTKTDESGDPSSVRSRGLSGATRPLTVSQWGGHLGSPALRSPPSALRLYVPTPYEPNYPYPLIVWLHAPAAPGQCGPLAPRAERQLAERVDHNNGRAGAPATAGELTFPALMSAISPQNYLGLGIRGLSEADGLCGCGWQCPRSLKAVCAFEDTVRHAVCELRRTYHVHSERIMLAGFDDGGTLALQLLLNRPEWFSGAVVLGGRFPVLPNPLRRFRELTGKRVLLGTGSHDRQVTAVDVIRAGRLLHAAGLHVTTRLFDTGHELTPAMLKHIDHWLLEGLAIVI